MDDTIISQSIHPVLLRACCLQQRGECQKISLTHKKNYGEYGTLVNLGIILKIITNSDIFSVVFSPVFAWPYHLDYPLSPFV